MKRIALSLFAALATVAFASEAIEFKRVDKVGDVKHYLVRIDFDLGGTTGDFTADVTQTVDSINAETKLAKVKHDMANGMANLTVLPSQRALTMPGCNISRMPIKASKRITKGIKGLPVTNW